MQDLARLFVAPVVVFLALVTRQYTQCVHRQLGVQRQGLEGSDDGIAAKDCGEPGNTGSNDVTGRRPESEARENRRQRFSAARRRHRYRSGNLWMRIPIGRNWPAVAEAGGPSRRLVPATCYLRPAGLRSGPVLHGFNGSSRSSQRMMRSRISVGLGETLTSVSRMTPSRPL